MEESSSGNRENLLRHRVGEGGGNERFHVRKGGDRVENREQVVDGLIVVRSKTTRVIALTNIAMKRGATFRIRR